MIRLEAALISHGQIIRGQIIHSQSIDFRIVRGVPARRTRDER
ncbi:hypothetical protein [Cyanobium sp. CH-040]|nr:hypothetical protein [Cyanobium sp. CH-040]